jgi:hypothetical protein
LSIPDSVVRKKLRDSDFNRRAKQQICKHTWKTDTNENCTCDARLRISPSLRCISAGAGNTSVAICAARAATKTHGEFGQDWLKVRRIVVKYTQSKFQNAVADFLCDDKKCRQLHCMAEYFLDSITVLRIMYSKCSRLVSKNNLLN